MNTLSPMNAPMQGPLPTASPEASARISKVLVVDDSVDIVNVLTLQLKRQGYQVASADCGEEALRRVTADPPDLVLMDVSMPGMDGMETCRRLKADPAVAHIPVVLLTCHDSDQAVAAGLDAGADDYVTKPCSRLVLAARVRSALRIKRSRDKVAEINRELAEELARRKRVEMELVQAQKLEAIGRLAAGIAHEINTPAQYVGDNIRFVEEALGELEGLLATIEELATGAREGIPPTALLAGIETKATDADIPFLRREVPRALQHSREGIEQIAGIVRAMKEFSHPGSEEKRYTDINHAIENTITVAHSQWKYVAELATDLDRSLPPVPCVAVAMNQVILNLVVNAAEAIAEQVGDGSRGKGRITVRTRRDGDWVEIQVADTGAGIPEAIRSSIFEPFFTTKELGRGTGQGLAIAHTNVVQKHGGSITVQSEVGRGTTFVVRLPLDVPP